MRPDLIPSFRILIERGWRREPILRGGCLSCSECDDALDLLSRGAFWRAGEANCTCRVGRHGLDAITACHLPVFLNETLLLLMSGFALWTSTRYARCGGRAALFTSVGVWTLTVLTKATAFPFAAASLLYQCWRQPPKLLHRAAAIGGSRYSFSRTWFDRPASSASLRRRESLWAPRILHHSKSKVIDLRWEGQHCVFMRMAKNVELGGLELQCARV